MKKTVKDFWYDNGIKISDKGVDFKGNKLNENSVDGLQYVLYGGKMYRTGNRRHFVVEINDIDTNEFIKTVDARYIRLIKPSK